MNCDVVIIGAGPAGIFTALEMLKKGSKKNGMVAVLFLILISSPNPWQDHFPFPTSPFGLP